MIHQRVFIGRWDVDFYFVIEDYDEEEILSAMEDAGASDDKMGLAMEIMYDKELNAGFTFSNIALHKAVVVIGPTSSGREFTDTLVHEIHHLAVAIASGLGVRLDGEIPAYISGDAARSLAGIICQLGCDRD